MLLRSPSFDEGGMIPIKFSCDGMDVSPELIWTNSPAGTKSFALICDDPDAPKGTWVHWVLFNIPPTTNRLHENFPAEKLLPDGTIHGINDFRNFGYGGPCPPEGTHRYYFRLYALDTELNLKPGANKAQLLNAMKGHIFEETSLMGKYTRS